MITARFEDFDAYTNDTRTLVRLTSRPGLIVYILINDNRTPDVGSSRLSTRLEKREECRFPAVSGTS